MNKNYILMAVNKAGKNVYIDEVPNGKQCGCFCKECGGELVAKNNGKIKVHHFAHATGNDSIQCSQTALHILAKEIIAEERCVPSINKNVQLEFIHADEILLESNLGEIIPDILAVCGEDKIAIEIFVTHAVDNVKFGKILNKKLTTFEIDLSKIKYENKDDIKNAIYDTKNIRVIYDDKIAKMILEYKKELIKAKGIRKFIKSGIVQQCPMKCGVIGNRIAKMFDVRFSKCQNCFFSYISEDKESLLCMGNISQGESIPDWFVKANVNENRIMTNEEILLRLNEFKKM
ncbi:hypothetical protein [Treponema sp.]|uniref:hypothetical protein n=1 Tax=Treponema sp. TaxID=166 RepID=UPI00257A1923|nr:hypothetical protein [Treponema sp.]